MLLLVDKSINQRLHFPHEVTNNIMMDSWAPLSLSICLPNSYEIESSEGGFALIRSFEFLFRIRGNRSRGRVFNLGLSSAKICAP